MWLITINCTSIINQLLFITWSPGLEEDTKLLHEMPHVKYNETEKGGIRSRQLVLNGSQMAKLKKKIFLSCYFHEMYMEVVGLKKIYLKNYDFSEYVEFGAISRKIDILPRTS